MVWVGFFQVLWQEHRIFSGTVAELFVNRDTERPLGLYYQQPSFHLLWQPTYWNGFTSLPPSNVRPSKPCTRRTPPPPGANLWYTRRRFRKTSSLNDALIHDFVRRIVDTA